MLRCPIDGSVLEVVDFVGVQMDSCPYCDSAWLDAGELKALHKLESDLLGGAGLETADTRGSIQCPRCVVPMRTRFFSDTRRVVVDHCAQCNGIWLDTSEMRAILSEAYQRRNG